MALSANANIIAKPQPAAEYAAIVKSAAVIYNGALCQFDTTTGGLVEPYSAAANIILAGWHLGDTVTGSSSYGMAKLHSNIGVALLTVAAIAGDATDIGKPVYATDDGTFTVTSPANGVRIGNIVQNALGGLAPSGTAWVLTRDITGELST